MAICSKQRYFMVFSAVEYSEWLTELASISCGIASCNSISSPLLVHTLVKTIRSINPKYLTKLFTFIPYFRLQR
jgi:hypothetical protein